MEVAEENKQLIDPLCSSDVADPADHLQPIPNKRSKQQKTEGVRDIKSIESLESVMNIRPAKNGVKRADNVQPNSKFECYLCKQSLKTFAKCQEHYLSAHINVNCEICSVNLSPDDLKKHLCQVQSIKCDYCDEFHETTISLLKHLECHKDQYKLHRCTCSKVFPSIFFVNAHKVQHNLEILSRRFACEICGQRFKKRGDLIRHTRLKHSTERRKHLFVFIPLMR